MDERACRRLYPAVLSREPGREVAAVFPDLGVATSGVDYDDALASARELLEAALRGMEQDGEEVPEPTPLADVELGLGERAVLVGAGWMHWVVSAPCRPQAAFDTFLAGIYSRVPASVRLHGASFGGVGPWQSTVPPTSRRTSSPTA